MPVVADHLPAPDKECRDHQHDWDAQPDLREPKRRPRAAPFVLAARELLWTSDSAPRPVLSSRPTGSPSTGFRAGSRFGVVIHVSHTFVILFSIDPNRVPAVKYIADGLIAHGFLHFELYRKLLGSIAVVFLVADLERLDLLARSPGGIANLNWGVAGTEP